MTGVDGDPHPGPSGGPTAVNDDRVVPFKRRVQPVDARERYDAAARRQAEERLLASRRPVPARITIALDVCGLDGPEVDEACGTWEGNPAGDVDRWELALAVPSPDQVRLLAKLTGFPVSFFYRPVTPGPGLGPVWVCRSGRGGGCETVGPDVVDERGVLLYGGQPRTLPAAVQGELFTGGPRAEPKRPAREPAPAGRPAPAGVQAGRMPDDVRAALTAALAKATRNRRYKDPHSEDPAD